MIENKDYKIQAVTHIHIGSGESLFAVTDFIVLGKYVYVLEKEKLYKFLNEKKLLDDYLSLILRRPRNFSLESYFKYHGYFQENILRQLAQYVLNISGESRAITEIRSFVKSNGRPFIPGSSVKGALRVALLYNILKNYVDKKEVFFKQLLQKGNIGKMLEYFLQGFGLPRFDRHDSHTDILRCLRVFDSPNFSTDMLEVVPVTVMNIKNRSNTGPVIYVEALKPFSLVKIEISVDWYLFEKFKRENSNGMVLFETISRIPLDPYESFLKKPFVFTKRMVQDVLAHEKKRLPSSFFDFRREPNFRLGWGQGQLATTVFLLLPEDVKKRIRARFFTQALPEPINRKIVREELLGWAWVGVKKQEQTNSIGDVGNKAN